MAMGKETDISWCDSSVNAQMGCNGCELWTKHTKTCYAGVMTEQYAGRKGWPDAFDKPKIFPDRIAKAARWPDLTGKDRPDKPWLNGLPRLIFLNDMGDTFTEGLSINWLDPYMETMINSPHIHLVLTKRVRRMMQYFTAYGGVPDNLWLGASVTDQATARGRLQYLNKIEAKVKFVSYEPALSPVDFEPFFVWHQISWLIDGGESGRGARQTPAGVFANTRDMCKKHGVAYFHKQNGGSTKIGGVWGGNQLDGRVYHEMPKCSYKPVKAGQMKLL